MPAQPPAWQPGQGAFDRVARYKVAEDLHFLKVAAMRWHIQRLLGGALAVVAAALHLSAQSALTLTVEDSRGAALAGATVEDAAGRQLGRANEVGRLTVQCSAPCSLRVAAAGFREVRLQLGADAT
ncbi:MAG: hypothetical protein ABSD43_09650, partial [Terracidiphilus sp.]